MTEGMVEHLQMLVASAIFNPALLFVLVCVWIFGRILGGFMPWHEIVKPMVILFVIGLVLKLTMFRAGYDFYFLFGFPFMAGLWAGSRRRGY
jgi:hypothetical protein